MSNSPKGKRQIQDLFLRRKKDLRSFFREKKNLRFFFLTSAVENRLRFSTAEERLLRFLRNRRRPVFSYSRKERSSMRGARSSIGLPSSIFFSLSPENSMNFRGTRRLPSQIASDLRRETSVSSDFWSFFSKEKRRIFSSSFGRGKSIEIGGKPVFFSDPYMGREKQRGSPQHVYFFFSQTSKFFEFGRLASPFMGREKKRGSPQHVEETRHEHPNSRGPRSRIGAPGENLDVRLRHKWLGKKILPFFPIRVFFFEPYMLLSPPKIACDFRGDRLGKKILPFLPIHVFFSSAPAGQRKKTRESESEKRPSPQIPSESEGTRNRRNGRPLRFRTNLRGPDIEKSIEIGGNKASLPFACFFSSAPAGQRKKNTRMGGNARLPSKIACDFRRQTAGPPKIL